MNDRRFDNLARTFAPSTSRRAAVRSIAASVLGGRLGWPRPQRRRCAMRRARRSVRPRRRLLRWPVHRRRLLRPEPSLRQLVLRSLGTVPQRCVRTPAGLLLPACRAVRRGLRQPQHRSAPLWKLQRRLPKQRPLRRRDVLQSKARLRRSMLPIRRTMPKRHLHPPAGLLLPAGGSLRRVLRQHLNRPEPLRGLQQRLPGIRELLWWDLLCRCAVGLRQQLLRPR